MKHLILILALLFSQSLQSQSKDIYWGTWDSGGGELVRGSTNPWFFQNTKTIHYCLLVDSGNFGSSESTIRNAVKDAFAFWKSEFGRAHFYNDFELGQQQFVERQCSDPDVLLDQTSSINLVLQMGDALFYRLPAAQE